MTYRMNGFLANNDNYGHVFFNVQFCTILRNTNIPHTYY